MARSTKNPVVRSIADKLAAIQGELHELQMEACRRGEPHQVHDLVRMSRTMHGHERTLNNLTGHWDQDR